MVKKVFISIAGNIGSGKSTLAEKVAAHFSFDFYKEPVEENPYAKDFYADMKRYSFQQQMYYITKRAQDHLAIQNSTHSVVQDRSIYEDSQIFAKNLFESGLMQERDYKVYCENFEIYKKVLIPPNLLVYLNTTVETDQKRIEKRGRPEEQGLVDDSTYLKSLKKRYDTWIMEYPYRKLILPMDNLNVVDDKKDLEIAVYLITKELKDLEAI